MSKDTQEVGDNGRCIEHKNSKQKRMEREDLIRKLTQFVESKTIEDVKNSWVSAKNILDVLCVKYNKINIPMFYEEWQKILHYAGKYECEYTSCVMDYENLKEENEKLKKNLEIAVNALKSCRLSKKTVVTEKKEVMYIWDYALEKIND